MKTRTIKAADLFAGAGGATTGLVDACDQLGVGLNLVAVNHWPTAVETHAANYPEHKHICEDIESVNPRKAVPGGKLDLLLAGPECTHHSTARGGKPMNDQSRSSAWCILRWATALTIDTILIENVKEWSSWGPIGSNGRPLKSRKGETFRAFIEALRSLGYKVAWRIFNSADYGDPTTRERLFMQARRGRRPITWPEPTHSPRGGKELFRETQPWVPAREIIDWSIKSQSVFSRKRPLSPNTIARIAAGLRKFGGTAAEPFLVMLNGTTEAQVNGSVRSIDDPAPTITAGGEHVGLCHPYIATFGHLEPATPVVVLGGRGRNRRTVSLPEYLLRFQNGYVHPFIVPNNANNLPKSVNDPVPTVTGANRLFLCEPFIVPQFGEARPKSASEPLWTITTTSRGIGLVEPFIIGQQSCSAPRSTSAPLPTIATAGAIALVEPFLVPTNYGERPGQCPRCHSLHEPLPTVVGSQTHALVEPFIVGAGGPQGMGPARSVNEPLRTVLTRDHMALVEPFIISMEHSGANGKQVRSINDPLPTITTRGDLRVCEPFVLPCNHGRDNRTYRLDRPMPTITTVDAWGLIEPFLTRYNNNRADVCARSISEPIPTIDCNDRYGIVIPGGQGVAVDIRFRMLQPHELARAMSFPREYKFVGNREQKVKQIGNAWTGKLAAALCLAILEEP